MTPGTKKPVSREPAFSCIGGEGGIRTLDTRLAYTHFPGVLLRPLGHFSGKLAAKVISVAGTSKPACCGLVTVVGREKYINLV